MANTLTNIMPKILARGLLALRQRVLMPRLVNSDYSVEAAKKGDVVNIPKSRAATASAVTPAVTAPTPADATQDNVQLTLANWQHSDFQLSDKDMVQIDKDQHFIPLQVAEAVKALANAVNLDIMAQYKGVYGYVGTAGTTPFASTPNLAAEARAVLNRQLAPRESRRGVLNFDAEANALALAAFRDASQSGKTGPIIEGEMGRFFGVDWVAEDHVLTHTAGTASGYVTNGVQALGATSIVLQTGTGTLVVGDIITFAGHTQTYTVITGIAAPGTVVIQPPLVVQVAGSVAVTLRATHVVNLMFQRDAFAFATRPLVQATAGLELGNQIMSMQDPKSGITLRLEVMRQYKQVVWDFDILWGSGLIRPELATRIAG